LENADGMFHLNFFYPNDPFFKGSGAPILAAGFLWSAQESSLMAAWRFPLRARNVNVYYYGAFSLGLNDCFGPSNLCPLDATSLLLQAS
jgi:hypothetical protein